MQLRVLGSAAGGGFPQWNCGCENCRLQRSGSTRARARTQDSIAVSQNGDEWLLLNASPDIHRQIEAAPKLQPRGPRHSPIAGVVLTNGDLDHVLGLFSLRESQPLTIFATERVRRGLVEHNAFLRTLDRFAGQVTWRDLPIGRDVTAGELSLRAIAAPGKAPIHLKGIFAPSPEDNIAVVVRGGGRTVLYATAVGAFDENIWTAAREADVVFFDGTFWSSEELIAQGLGRARAEEMAHWPIGGETGSLARLAQLKGPRKFYSHLNNTNPILVEDSAERRAVEAAGVSVAHDGLELSL